MNAQLGQWPELTYGGVLVLSRRRYSLDLVGVASSGIPFDNSVTFRPGFRPVPEFIRGLGELNSIGMDVVEVSPPHDKAEITAPVAQDWLRLLAEENGAKRVTTGRL